MKTDFHCDKCNREFDSAEACLKHEETCGQLVCVTLYYAVDSWLYDVRTQFFTPDFFNVRDPKEMAWHLYVPNTPEAIAKAKAELLDIADSGMRTALEALADNGVEDSEGPAGQVPAAGILSASGADNTGLRHVR